MKAPRLKEWRETLGESQVSLGEKAGVSQYTILRIEHGEDLRPSTARKLAKAMGIQVADLVDSPPRPSGKAEAPAGGPEPRWEDWINGIMELLYKQKEDLKRLQDAASTGANSEDVYREAKTLEADTAELEAVVKRLMADFVNAAPRHMWDLPGAGASSAHGTVLREDHPEQPTCFSWVALGP